MLRRSADEPESQAAGGGTGPVEDDGKQARAQAEEDLFAEEEMAASVEDAEENLPVVSLREVAATQLLGSAMHEDGRDLVEALLFGSEEVLSVEGLAAVLGCFPEDVREAIEALNRDYEEQGRAFTLRELAGGVQLVSRRRYGELLRKLLKTRVKQRLSRAALETLAVVAYKQPLTKTEIEAIRGVKADGVIRTLLDRKLVEIGGRSDAVGRPLLYRTTREFLEYFGLRALDDLPRLKEIKDLLKGRDHGDEDLPPELLGERNPVDEEKDSSGVIQEDSMEADPSDFPVDPSRDKRDDAPIDEGVSAVPEESSEDESVALSSVTQDTPLVDEYDDVSQVHNHIPPTTDHEADSSLERRTT